MVSFCSGQFIEIGFTSFCLRSIALPDKQLSLPGLWGLESQHYVRKNGPSWVSSKLNQRTAHSQRSLRFTTRNSASEDPAPSPESGSFVLSEESSFLESSGDKADNKRSSFVVGNQQQDARERDTKSNAVKRAFERAAEYKKRKELGLSTSILPSKPHTLQNQGQPLSPSRPADGDLPQVEIIRRQEQVLESASEGNFATNLPFRADDSGAPAVSSSQTPSAQTGESGYVKSQGQEIADSLIDVKAVIEQKVAEWASNSENGSEAGSSSVRPVESAAGEEKRSHKILSAFEKAKRYKQQTNEMVAAIRESDSKGGSSEDSTKASPATADNDMMEIEIVTRDGVIRRKVMNSKEQLRAFSNVKDVKKKGVTGIDFAGLGFADKKKSGRPAGLASDGFVTPPKGPLPQVEIITRDAAPSGSPQAGGSVETAKEAERLYKPRVSSWGVFARPADISKTYGGGRTIRPGENLETDEEKEVREARTAQLLDEYRKKMGLNVDPAVKAEAQQIYNRADGLSNNGRLTEALMLYELVMKKMPPQSELHGLAALQAGLCLDSQSRYVEARAIYEKILSHPIARIGKQARRLLFGFQAMEELNVNTAQEWDSTLYRKYFDSFADGYNTSYKASAEEKQDNMLPFVLLFLLAFLMVAALAVTNSR